MYLIYTVYNNFKFILLTSIALHSLSVRNACLILSLLHMKYLSILFYLNVLHLFGLEFFEHLYSQLLHVQYVCHSPVGGGGGGGHFRRHSKFFLSKSGMGAANNDENNTEMYVLLCPYATVLCLCPPNKLI